MVSYCKDDCKGVVKIAVRVEWIIVMYIIEDAAKMKVRWLQGFGENSHRGECEERLAEG